VVGQPPDDWIPAALNRRDSDVDPRQCWWSWPVIVRHDSQVMRKIARVAQRLQGGAPVGTGEHVPAVGVAVAGRA